MNAAMRAAHYLGGELAAAVRRLGGQVAFDGPALLDRGTRAQGAADRSPNDYCRLLAGDDGWLAVNLSRGADRELLPAWLSVADTADPWADAASAIAAESCAALLERARLLGLPVSRVGEISAESVRPRAFALGECCHKERPVVLDCSALWAGPLCGALLAEAGFDVIRLESIGRRDPTRINNPALDHRLNGRKRRIECDFRDRAALRDHFLSADIVITSARRRAYFDLALEPETLIGERPGFIWAAISGYGWTGNATDRVAFGDDAAAAGGLVDWAEGRPLFMGDALADPLTGMAAALAVLEAIEGGGGCLIDAAMAYVAAGARLQ